MGLRPDAVACDSVVPVHCMLMVSFGSSLFQCCEKNHCQLQVVSKGCLSTSESVSNWSEK